MTKIILVLKVVQEVGMLKGIILNNNKNAGSSKKMDGILNRYKLKSTRRIYTFGVLKCSEKLKVSDFP